MRPRRHLLGIAVLVLVIAGAAQLFSAKMERTGAESRDQAPRPEDATPPRETAVPSGSLRLVPLYAAGDLLVALDESKAKAPEKTRSAEPKEIQDPPERPTVQNQPVAIVNIASEMGRMGNPRSIPYGVSKAAVIQLSRAMALDLARDNIRVNAVAPGGTRTPMLEQSIVAQGYEVEEGLIAYSRRVPMKRFARMDEVTPAILFIASDAASYITGAVLSVDGGTTATGPGAPLEDAKTA
ncbi:MAG: SDR family oxidoreductase [Rhodospirillales bacterium]|nr:SDR family oxidoreductase [Rhodospirillales bacterium]